MQGEDFAGEAATPMLDLPGRDPQSPDRVVLSARPDGHPMGESARDNASGLAVAQEPFVREATVQIGLPVATCRVPMADSGHANFAAHGIPALRLVAGFDRPDSSVRHILTAQDTRDKVAPGEK